MRVPDMHRDQAIERLKPLLSHKNQRIASLAKRAIDNLEYADTSTTEMADWLVEIIKRLIIEKEN